MIPEFPLPADLPATRFGDAFPADDPDSPWLFRLSILRDDLDFELRHLAMDGEASTSTLWNRCYFLRRLSVTFHELKNVWVRHVGRAVQDWGIESEAQREILVAESKILAVAAKLKLVRDALGGHVRLTNAKPEDLEGEAFERGLLALIADWKAVVLLDAITGRGTNLRGLTMAALFAITGTDTPEKLGAWHEDLALVEACGEAMHAIDFLIFAKLSDRQRRAPSSAATTHR